MLCDNCKINQAGVHTVTIINGLKQERYLCAECAKSAQFSLPSIMDLLSGVQAAPQQAEIPACACGNSFTRFRQTGLLGCPECYKTFEAALTPVIKRAQGGKLRHVGRKPQQLTEKEQEPAAEREAPCGPKSECGRLRGELKKAVAEERYERAAELRDRLRVLEGEENA
ncbi:MAG TPA: UvrB/UvrC motif-containing protein [Feifaniaceae bacterium]|nr:UvrB/UvrC motif-containing protein [Feifaniaceae bacterium]